jgi:hydroxyacylglutathione hydrolase
MQHNLQIIPIPAFKDNYIWLIHNGHLATVVDPGDATPVLETLQYLNLTLNNILITHHHHDHIDGVAELLIAYPKAIVYAPKLEQYTFNHISLDEPDIIDIKEFDLKFAVMNLPGHTVGHIAYYAEQPSGNHMLFCGDVIFGAGCGRVPEGSYAQAFQSLQKLTTLPAKTKLYCTHEYTLHNINFALSLEPNNQDLINRFKETQKLRDVNLPSLPSTITLELATNPFLRCNSEEIQSAVQLKNASFLEIFSAVRLLRNNY